MHKNQYYLTLQLKQYQVANHIQLYTMIIDTLFFTAEANSSCAVGFLNQISLGRIVDAPRDNSVHQLLNFSEDATAVLLTSPVKPGYTYLMRVTIAAKFNHAVPYGWPSLQVRRPSNNGSYVSVYVTESEPRSTGYLNVFEYDLSDDEFELRPGEQIRLSWIIRSSNPARYSLGYYQASPMAFGVTELHQNGSVTTMSEINKSTCSSSHMSTAPPTDDTTMLTTTMDAQKLKQSDETTIAIVGGVLCTMAVIILIVVLTITVFVVYRFKNHTKKFSPSTNDTLHASVLPTRTLAPIIRNPTYSIVDSKFQCIIMDSVINCSHNN